MNQLNKLFKELVLFVVATSLGGGTLLGINSAHAASWHKGTPSFLVGKKFRSKYRYHHGMPVYVHLNSTKNTIDFIYSESDGYGGNHTAYKKSGSIYTVRYRAIDWQGTHKYHTYNIKHINSKYIKVDGLTMVRFYKYPKYNGYSIY